MQYYMLALPDLAICMLPERFMFSMEAASTRFVYVK